MFELNETADSSSGLVTDAANITNSPAGTRFSFTAAHPVTRGCLSVSGNPRRLVHQVLVSLPDESKNWPVLLPKFR